MNSRTILATLIGAVVSFLMGWLIYGVILRDYMQTHTVSYEGLMKPDSKLMVSYILGNILQAIALCYVLLIANVKLGGRGAMIGGITTFLFLLSMNIYFYAGMNWYTSFSAFLVDLVASVIIGTLVGAAIGFMLGRGNKTA